MAAGRDGENVRQAEVPRRQPLLEGGDEAAGGPIHVDSHLPALRTVQFLQDLVHLPDRIILATVVVAHDADHSDCLLVDHVLELGGVEGEGLPARGHEARLDIHIFEKLLPCRLEHGRDDKVGIDAPDFILVHLELLCVPLTPAELHREAREQTGLCGSHGAGAGVAAVLVKVTGLRAVPELRNHVQRVVVHLEGLWVHGLVGEVDLQPHGRHLLLLRLKDNVHVGAGVQTLGEVKQVVILDLAKAVTGSRAIGRDGHVLFRKGRSQWAAIVWRSHSSRRRF
mmetsp:Transcript_22580/g.46826  ORF Transcript_22580/g.46826 Transcript_22580/m.46826 type:complete len:282 (-) Transcript_22580:4-849(-)